MSRRTFILGIALVGLLTGRTLQGDEPERRVEFNRDVRSILADKCFPCHGPDANHRKAELRLDTAQGATADLGGRSAISPGKPAESELLARVTSDEKTRRMPPRKTGKDLTPDEVATLRRWIEQGAVYQPHWSFIAPSRPQVPETKLTSWPRGPIDRFILHGIERAGLEPSPEASSVTLLRRLSFDLVGLPPNPADVDEFVSASAAKPQAAYEELVDRLLASPHFGERMATYWLDLVRYADTVGYHGDQEHHAWPYRDWVIKAFNDNMPFDRFTAEQLAGDLLPNATADQKIASCYNRLLQTTHEGGAQDKEYLAKYASDRIRNLSGVWLGATLGCAECHNHKFDPYTQKDFYSFQAFFADVEERGAFKGPDATPTARPPEMDVVSPLDPQRKGKVMFTNAVKPRVIRVLKRGDWMDETGEIVEPRTPSFFPPLDVKGRATRLDLAQWLTTAKQPQTARVFVNRLWYLFFGAGLCRSLEDTGAQGEWPTHPELLDYLAVEFVESGWDVKHMVRLIVTSSAYRQASSVGQDSNPARKPGRIGILPHEDPENRLFARQNRFRIPAEMVRDNALSVSGLLGRRLGGPPARPYQPDGYYEFLNFPKRTYKADADANQYRRGVYTHWQRQFLHPMMKAFDAPYREECTARRPISNTPLAALVLLNDPTFVEAARILAERILREGGVTETDRISWAWEVVLSRKPSERETSAVLRLYKAERETFAANPKEAERSLKVGLSPVPAHLDPVELAAWTSVARLLLNLNETTMRN